MFYSGYKLKKNIILITISVGWIQFHYLKIQYKYRRGETITHDVLLKTTIV